MQAVRAAPPPPLAGAAAMQAEQAAQHAAQQQLNAAALATMLSHGQPGQQYAQGALAQLLAFGAGQPVWPPHALAGQLQPPPAQPDAAPARTSSGGEERKTTNYAARHQACGAWRVAPRSLPLYPFHVTPLPQRCAPCADTACRARHASTHRRLRSGDATASTTGWLRCAKSRPSPPAQTRGNFSRSCSATSPRCRRWRALRPSSRCRPGSPPAREGLRAQAWPRRQRSWGRRWSQRAARRRQAPMRLRRRRKPQPLRRPRDDEPQHADDAGSLQPITHRQPPCSAAVSAACRTPRIRGRHTRWYRRPDTPIPRFAL